jgi:hypothetical protein
LRYLLRSTAANISQFPHPNHRGKDGAARD